MAWPPPVLPVNRTNATVQTDNHIYDHNTANQAINDLVTQVQALQGRLSPTGRGAVGRNSNAVSVNTGTATDVGTIASINCVGGDIFYVEVSGFATITGGNASHILHLGIEASGGGISQGAQTSLDSDQALLGGGSGQTLQIPMYVSKIFTPGNTGTFSAGGRGWVTSSNSGSASSLSANRCVITRLN